jgi:hypothetical protein
MSFITIGADCGGPEAGVVGKLKVPLSHAIERNVTASHCTAVDKYALVLRIDGSLDKFGPEGLTRLRFAKARRYITIDVQVPESAWNGKSVPELKRYLATMVTEAIRACVARLRQDRYPVQELLFTELSTACSQYLAASHDI